MITPGRGGRRGQALAFLLCAVLAAGGTALTVVGGWDAPPPAPFGFPWPLLAVLFVGAQRLSVDFEFREQSRRITLGQLPLALGAVAVAPVSHLVAAALASAVVSLVRREGPVRSAFNLGVCAVEVGAVTAALHVAGRPDQPGPSLWLALLGGLLVGELAGQLVLPAVWWLLGMPVRREEVAQPLLLGVASTSLFAAVAVVAVAAVWADPLITVVILFLVLALALAYRGHRRLSAQQTTTERLYDFVKDLGPLDVDDPATRETLVHVRTLLNARTLDLAVCDPDRQWRHIVVWDGAHGPGSDGDRSRLAEHVAHTGTPTLQGRRGGGEQMATPVVGNGGLLGILTATERLGDVRDFDMGDLRLLETIAAELATALERGRMLSELARAATTDPLTGLPNLAETTRRLDVLVSAPSGDVVLAAVAVDSFREVNDTLGHQVGDDLLLEVTRRLQAATGGALLGRVGGGRFAVAVPAGEAADPSLFGLNLRAQVEGSAVVGGTGTHVRLSVGVVRAPDHGTDAATLLRRAQTVMYSARHAHGGPLMWEPAYEVKGQRRLAVVSALREALGNGSIGLAYQPKVDTLTGAVSGVEALARWSHPALGPVSPDEFIPLAEASGVMAPLTTAVLQQALTACRDWQDQAHAVGVSVNVSADTVLDPDFVTELAGVLASVGLPAGLVTLELTESVLVADAALAVERMAELRTLGVRISVDDFGTGYSSLTYLKGLPVDEVKIDKGFVTGLQTEPADRAVVRAVVDIAHTLGLKVVAEGVEEEGQQRLLRELGVDEAQGYLHARPMPAGDMAGWLRERRATARR